MKPTAVLLADRAAIELLAERIRLVGEYVEHDFFDVLKVGECEIGLDFSNDVLTEYERDELMALEVRFAELGSILVEYESKTCLHSILREVLPGLHGVVDNNFGNLIEFTDFIQMELS